MRCRLLVLRMMMSRFGADQRRPRMWGGKDEDGEEVRTDSEKG